MNCICCATKFDATTGSCPRCAWDPNATHPALAGYTPGATVHRRYVIRESLGAGRLGVSILADDTQKGRPVVLKFIHPGLIPDEDAGMRFLTAMNGIRSLGDPILAVPSEAAQENGRYFLVRTYFEGPSLKQLMDDQRITGQIFPLDEAVHLIEKLARALISIRGGCHGAFSPTKVWVPQSDLKIVDYGVVAALHPAAAWHALRRNTRAPYIAPELADNRPPDSGGDVYALGVLLGELLSLAEFDGDPDIFRQSEPDFPREMEALIRCALSRDTDARYAHPMDFVSALYDVLGRPRSMTMPPDNTAVVPAAFLNELRSLSIPPPSPEAEEDDDLSAGESSGREITKQVHMDDIARESQVGVSPPPAPPTDGFSPPPFRPTDLGALARATRSGSPTEPHRAPPPPASARRSLLPPVPATTKANAGVPVPIQVPKPSKAPAPPAPLPAAPTQRPTAAAKSPVPTVAAPPQAQTPSRDSTADEISSLKAMLTPKSVPPPPLPAPPPAIQPGPAASFQPGHPIGPPPAFPPAPPTGGQPTHSPAAQPVPPPTAQPAAPPASPDSRETGNTAPDPDRYEGINPRFLRAAAKLEEARVEHLQSEGNRTEEEEEWRKQLESTTSNSVISFLPPTTIENPQKVEGFPENQRNRKPQLTMRPVTPPKPPPVPNKK